VTLAPDTVTVLQDRLLNLRDELGPRRGDLATRYADKNRMGLRRATVLRIAGDDYKLMIV